MKNNSLSNTVFAKLPANVDYTETPFYKIYRYYSTDIIRLENDNVGTKIILSTGGYYTSSTRRYMINLLAREGIKVGISFAGNKYSVKYNNKEYYFNLKDTCEFYV